MSRRRHAEAKAGANQPGWCNGAPSFIVTGDSGPDYITQPRRICRRGVALPAVEFLADPVSGFVAIKVK